MATESMTTKDVAAKLNITGKQLRRILRSFDRYADGKYTRYQLGKRDVEQVAKYLKPEPAPKKAKKTTPPPVETPVTETATA